MRILRRNSMTRKEALRNIEVMDENLPKCLKDNNIKSDELLFKEAQYLHYQRKILQQRQIIIDNIHFVTTQKILQLAKEQTEEEAEKKKQRDELKYQARLFCEKAFEEKMGTENFDRLLVDLDEQRQQRGLGSAIKQKEEQFKEEAYKILDDLAKDLKV